MCMFGLTAVDAEGEGSAKKPTRVLTNLPSIAAAISRRCSGDHRHVHLISGKAKAAAKYTEDFCQAIVSGIACYLECLAAAQNGEAFNVDFGELLEAEMEPELPFTFNDSGWCVDDVRGGELPMELVREGRREEMQGFAQRRVYDVRPRWEATSRGLKVVGVRWVDTLKGGKARCRLVCQDFNNDKNKTDEMFAPTPPLMATRWLCSCAASQGTGGLGRKTLMTIDFSKAFLYGEMRREVYIELPDEDSRKYTSDVIGLLNKSMYGLRDAPQIWQGVVRSMLESRGFKPLIGTQCMYVHPRTGLAIVAHVDVFLVLGSEAELRELLLDLQREYECTGQLLGLGEYDVRDLKFLGRRIRLTGEGIEWEGDPKHAPAFVEKLMEEFGGSDPDGSLRAGLKSAQTPGVKLADIPNRVPLGAAAAKAYRGLVALANYMCLDRCDLGFASKEVSKTMSSPAECDLTPLKRLGRYLVQYPRCVSIYRWQDEPATIDMYSDSDWGGDLVSRRSTSGGALLRGEHLILHYSRTQQVVSLSSAEAELHGLCKAASEGLAASNMAAELYIPLPLRLLTDSSAARGIIQRAGCGKVKHLDVKSLWLQEREAKGDLSTVKIPSLQNCSDLLTHHYSEPEAVLHLARMSVERRRDINDAPARGGH